MTQPSRPALRYHGGKWKLAPWVLEHFPPHRVYVEPFGGAASLLMRKARSMTEIYNDVDAEIVNVFRILRDAEQSQRLADLLALTPYARDEFQSAYEECADPIEQARRLIVRSQMGQGSLGATRATRSGFNTRLNGKQGIAAQAGVMARLPGEIAEFTHRLQGVIIENRNAVDVIRQYDRKDALIYCDPPYMPETRTGGARSYRHEMSAADHKELSECLRGAVAMVIVSGYPSKQYERWYGKWQRHQIAHMAHGAKPRTEVLWLNPRAANALERTRAQPSLIG